jgi:predicted PurR-regulated permease PerM
MFSPNVPPAASRRPSLLAFVLIVAALYFGKEVLLPLALATLLAFLLTPMVRRLETWKMPRVPAVLFVMLLTVSILGGIGWAVANQLLDVIGQLPDYKANIERKLESFHGPQGGVIAKATDSVQELSKELSAGTPKEQPQQLPRHPSRTQQKAPAAVPVKPVPVELVEPPPTAMRSLRDLLGPLLAPIGGAVIVIVFALVMLIRREDLRDRLVRLIGQGRINLVTQAFDEATQRVSKYLRMQFLVNTTFAGIIAFGLHFIGLPGALLWGVMAGMLRFIPYIGPVIGGGVPFVISLAVFADWKQPLLALGLFLVAELIVAYVIEPWLYGKNTGISPLAILVAAAFWAAIWGPVGLILSTPLTVCLVVMGRYVPQFEFLYVMLGDQPVLAPEVQFYQRLLATDQQEARAVMEQFLLEKSPTELYDGVFIPALSMAEADRHKGALDEVKENFLIQSVGEFIAELAETESNSTVPLHPPNCRIVCLPAHDKADEVSAAMLAQLLEAAGLPVVSLPVTSTPTAMLEEVSIQPDDIVCISALPPFAVLNARSLNKKLRTRFPCSKFLVGLWNSAGDPKMEERIEKAFPGEVVTTLAAAVEEIQRLIESGPLCETPASPASRA